MGSYVTNYQRVHTLAIIIWLVVDLPL
jgi:hypothetical protein